mmetsp:Transcript_14285/g.22009  ORF Transcript_14285/g.22009 Transcript_14285/m.22009 type:complete len:203 (+) Transcript_14285:437-1045(+)
MAFAWLKLDVSNKWDPPFLWLPDFSFISRHSDFLAFRSKSFSLFFSAALLSSLPNLAPSAITSVRFIRRDWFIFNRSLNKRCCRGVIFSGILMSSSGAASSVGSRLGRTCDIMVSSSSSFSSSSRSISSSSPIALFVTNDVSIFALCSVSPSEINPHSNTVISTSGLSSRLLVLQFSSACKTRQLSSSFISTVPKTTCLPSR